MTQSLRTSVRQEVEIRQAETSLPLSSDVPGIGGRIRHLRERLGLTQEKLAARLGVAFPTVNRWENGHTQPSPLALKQIEALLAEAGRPGGIAAAGSAGNPGVE